MSNTMGLSAPWVTFYREIDALFGGDPEIKITYYEDDYTICLYVNNEEKAEALSQLLPNEKKFGNVVLKIKVLPANEAVDENIELFQRAFSGNPAVAFIHTATDPTGGKLHFVVFEKKVVQFFNDNLRDIAGNESTLFQEIARDVFGDYVNISFCTDPSDTTIASAKQD